MKKLLTATAATALMAGAAFAGGHGKEVKIGTSDRDGPDKERLSTKIVFFYTLKIVDRNIMQPQIDLGRRSRNGCSMRDSSGSSGAMKKRNETRGWSYDHPCRVNQLYPWQRAQCRPDARLYNRASSTTKHSTSVSRSLIEIGRLVIDGLL